MTATQNIGPQIRRAHLEDANTIAEFLVRVWRETYRTVEPAEAIKMLDQEHRLRSSQNSFNRAVGDQITLVAAYHTGLVGFTGFGATKQVELQDLAEIKHLYVDQRWRRRRVGRRPGPCR